MNISYNGCFKALLTGWDSGTKAGYNACYRGFKNLGIGIDCSFLVPISPIPTVNIAIATPILTDIMG